MTLLVEVPRGRTPERLYAVDVMLGHFLGVEHTVTAAHRTDVRVTCPGDPAGREVRVADDLLGRGAERWLSAAMLPREPLGSWDVAGDLPEAGVGRLAVLFGAPSREGAWMTSGPGRVDLGADLFGTAFFLLTRAEEIVCGARDRHGRFPSQASVLARAGLLERPVVDECAEVLRAALLRVWPGLPTRVWSRRVLLTHDVDWPLVTLGRSRAQVARAAAADLVQRREPGLAVRRMRAARRVRRGDPDSDPGNTFDLILETSERLGLASAFYFIADASDRATDCAYHIDDPWIRRLMARIHARGQEVGLHPSYHTFRDPPRIAREFAALRGSAAAAGVRQERWGGRQHYLRWENPVTWQAWEDAGLSYDSSLCFADRPGLRCGTLRPYPAFNLRSRRRLGLTERPTAVMDATLLRSGAGPEEAGRRIAALDGVARRHGGDMILLWHNTYLLTRAHRDLYGAVVRGLAA